MNLLTQQNNYENFTHDYSSMTHDTKFYTYLKKTYENINLNQINVRISKEDISLFVSNLDTDFDELKKKYYENHEQDIDETYIIKGNFLEYGKKNNERFHMFLLTIVDDISIYGHANTLIYDNVTNTVYRFEPNGEDFHKELNDYFTNYFSKYGIKYSLLRGFVSNNIVRGPQDFAHNVEQSQNDGTCLYWSNMFCQLIQENYNNYYIEDEINLQDFIQDFYYQLYKSGFSYSGFINNFISMIKDIDLEKLLDPSVDKIDVNWERMCFNENMTEEYIKKILKEYWYHWDTLCSRQNMTEEFKKANDIYNW